jgi:hypothetical protein
MAGINKNQLNFSFNCAKRIVMYRLRTSLDNLCKKLDISILYHSKVGVKCLNQLITSEIFRWYPSSSLNVIPIDELYLSVDGLKDAHTLLYHRILDSPHFELMEILRSKGEITRSEYISRVSRGTLDFRPPYICDQNYIRNLYHTYNRKKVSIECGNYEPIKVYKIGYQYFIADGKHTAALCASMGISPKCIDVPMTIYDSFLWWVYHKMARYRSEYGKHIEFFESIKSRKASFI